MILGRIDKVARLTLPQVSNAGNGTVRCKKA
jgi:hypothetical protein